MFLQNCKIFLTAIKIGREDSIKVRDLSERSGTRKNTPCKPINQQATVAITTKKGQESVYVTNDG